ncbi:MAG TPA: protein kinase [Rhodothermales bacterium]|nr:protein kinase [Rhodothermales bacterium]
MGAGGMGEVYRARDTRLDRTVAIKILSSDFVKDPRIETRFQREAKTISALNHPYICSLFDVGDSYLVMEYCEGKTLAQRIDEGALPLDQVLEYGIQIADALDNAHRQGIIHRDLKPSNIMLTKTGVKLLDFGLAKQRVDVLPGSVSQVSTLDRPLTEDGQILGTIQYMAPESLMGKQVDARSDIFALGLILYEMVTGKPAFTGSSKASLIAAILEHEPQPITRLKPTSPPVLDHIIRACLAKEPDERMQTAHDVMLELGWILESRRDLALSDSPRRRKLWVAVIVTTLVGLAIGFLLARDRLSNPRLLQTSFTHLTKESGVESEVSISPDGKFIAYVSGRGNGDIYLRRVGGQKSVNLTESSAEDDSQPAFSPDGQTIAFRSERGGGGIFVMGATGESVKRLTDFGFSPAWSSDGREIVVSTERGNPEAQVQPATLWKLTVATGERRQLTDRDAIQPSWSPGGHRIAFSDRRGKGGDFDIATISSEGGEVVSVTDDPALDLKPVWSPDGKYLYFLSDRGGVMNLWRVGIDEFTGRTSEQPEPVTTPSRRVADFSISADNRAIAFTGSEGRYTLMKLPFDPIRETAVSDSVAVVEGSLSILWPDVSPDGQWIAFNPQLGFDQRDIYVIRSDGRELRQLTNDPANDLYGRWSPNGNRLAFVSNRGGNMDFWAINADGSGLRQITRASERIWNPQWSPDGTTMTATYAKGTLLFDLSGALPADAGKPIRCPDGGSFAAWSWSPDGKWLSGSVSLANGSRVPGVALYSFDTGKCDVVTNFGSFAVWLSDSRRLVFVHGNELWIVDRPTRKTRKLHALPSTINRSSLAVSRDNRAIYFTTGSVEADIWLMNMTPES